MSWFHRLIESRRVRNLTLGMIGVVGVGSGGGALLANYTVAGINPVYAARTSPPQLAARQDDDGWVRDVAVEVAGEPSTAFASDDRAEYSNARY